MELDISYSGLTSQKIDSFLEVKELKSPFDERHGDSPFGEYCKYLMEKSKIEGIRTTGIQRRIWMLMQEVGSTDPTEEQIEKADDFRDLLNNLHNRRYDWYYLDYMERVLRGLSRKWNDRILQMRLRIENDERFDTDDLIALAGEVDEYLDTVVSRKIPNLLHDRLQRLQKEFEEKIAAVSSENHSSNE